jgi:ribosomal protein S16
LAAVKKDGYVIKYIIEAGIVPSERVKELARSKGVNI